MRTQTQFNRRSLFVIASLLIALFTAQPSSAQSTADKAAVIKLYQSLGYTLFDSYDFTLAHGQTKHLDRYFSSSYEYAIVLLPVSWGVTDADMAIYDEDGTTYDSDKDYSETALLSLSLWYSRQMRIEVTNVFSDSWWDEDDFTLLIFGK